MLFRLSHYFKADCLAGIAVTLRAIINLSSRRIGADPGDGAVVLDAGAVRAAFSPRQAVSTFRRFDSVDLLVDDRRSLLSVKPQIAARMMTRGACRLVDPDGSEAITWSRLAGTGLGTLKGMIAQPFLARAVDARLDRLAVAPRARAFGSGPPLFVRADLWYGVKAGGSLGHIAGVLKGLAALGTPARLATTEAIPTIPAETPVTLIAPKPRQLLKAEWQQLAFNLDFSDALFAGWQGPPPRFVYQRHGLNLFGGLDLARRWNVPLVLEYNGPEVWVADHWGRPLQERDRAVRAETLSVGGADLIVAVSEVLADDLKSQGIAPERIAVIPNAVDAEMFHPDRDATVLRARHGLTGKTVIGFIGTFGPWHGVEVLVDAVAAMLAEAPHLRASVRLMLVGDGARMLDARERIAAHQLPDVVVLTGLVPQSAGPDHVAAFDIATAPTVENADGSAFFGSPTKLFEYLAAGKPCVASAIGQVSTIIRHGETGLLVPPGDVAALAAALLHLASDARPRRAMGDAARADAVAHHTYRARAEVLAERLKGLGYVG